MKENKMEEIRSTREVTEKDGDDGIKHILSNTIPYRWKMFPLIARPFAGNRCGLSSSPPDLLCYPPPKNIIQPFFILKTDERDGRDGKDDASR